MKNKKGLRNPALIAAAANTPQGQKAIGNTLENVQQTTSASLSIAKNVFWFSVVAGTGYAGYKIFVNRFSPISQNPLYRPAKISNQLAKSKADMIYRAMYGLGNGFKTVSATLQGLSHNDFIKVYNAFGGRKGVDDIFKRNNLIQWINDQFSQSEILRLRLIVPNFF